MKESFFNYRISLNNKKFIFNTNTSGLIELTEDPLTEIEKTYLYDNGFLVDDDCDEILKLEAEINENIAKSTDCLELTIALTNQCNFKCEYCYQDKNENVMTNKVAKEIIKKIDTLVKSQCYSSIHIHYFGGEPLLNVPILLYLNQEIRKISQENHLNYKAFLTTNGSLLSDEILSNIDFYSIQLTFDGLENTHNKLRKSNVFHFKEEYNLIGKIIEKTNAYVLLRMNICKQNKEDVLNLHKLIIDNYGTKRIQINPNRMIKYHKHDNFNMLTEKEYSDIIFQLYILMDELTGKYELPIPRSTPCKFLCGKAYSISPDGYLTFCSGLMEPEATKFSIININTKKKIHFREECRNCKCLPLCLGGCKIQYDLKAGCCIYEKYHLEDIIKYYLTKNNLQEEIR